ncbi:MAG: hypothetical protein AB7V19_07070 [Candidatus Bipolaricaulia bacterium]
MSTIKTDFGQGGANLTPNGSQGEPDLATALRDVADDLEELQTKYNALLAKLDADSGVGDTDYAATQAAAAMKTIKG